MASSDPTELFVQQLAENQNRLYGYVFSLLGNHSLAADVVQESNLVLWRKIDDFDSNKPFLPWAFAIARIQVLAHLRDQKRDRLLLDTELATSLSSQAEEQAVELDQLQASLRACLQTLTERNREIIEKRYLHSMSIPKLASSLDRTVSAVKVALMRSRRQLANCIQVRMAGGDS